ncbi:MAG: hypothetical protein K1060chlam1_00037 [Candidatus Anoxychlamydiales bacterium]|nr:hypothetical protein [Candidatus Anoxychlamydiales bacterium]
MKNVDFLTVLFVSIVYMVIYIAWYSNFLFGKIYQNILKTAKRKPPFYHYFLIFFSILVLSYIISLFEVLMGVTTFLDGVFLGFLIWLGFIVTHTAFLVLTFKRNWKLFVLDNILYLIALMIISGVLAG